MKITKKDLLLLGIVFAVLLIADQVTKAIAFGVMGENAPVTMLIPGFLGFNTVYNEGISFSIGANGEWTQPVVIAITAVASIVIVIFIIRLPKRRLLLRYALVLILAGAIGNLIDRIAMGAVRDFIYMNFGFVDFSNNVADLEITVGAVLFIVALLFVDEDAVFRRQKAPEERAVAAASEKLEGKGTPDPAAPQGGRAEQPPAEPGEGAHPSAGGGDPAGPTGAAGGENGAESSRTDPGGEGHGEA